MSKITVIDLGMNNLLSICRALEYCGAEVEKTDDYKKIIKSNKVVLPGVGAFGEAMKNLNKLNLVKESVVAILKDNRAIFSLLVLTPPSASGP